MAHVVHTSPRSAFFGRMQDDAPLLFQGGLFCAALVILFGLAATLDERVFQDVNVWVKPLKFALALAIYLLSLAFFARFASETHNRSRRVRRFHGVVLFCIVGELVWIGGAAMWGVGSHFNVSSLLMGTIYGVMGVFAVTLTTATLVQGIAILRQGGDAVVQSIGTSLIATFATTCLVAGYMSSNGSHFVGGSSSDLLPFLGWARDVGDLRVSHFFATHIMQFGPVMAIVLGFLGLSGRAVSYGPALFFGALTVATFVQAVMGLPFLPGIG